MTAIERAMAQVEGARRIVQMARSYPNLFTTDQLAVLERGVGIVEQDVEDLEEIAAGR